MDAKTPKPKGFKKFDALTRLLIQVPKSEIPERKPKFKRRKKGIESPVKDQAE
jgi:hypothetical protein